MSTRRMLGITSMLTILVFAAPLSAWEGEMIEREGVVTVINPESPARGADRLEMQALWTRGGESDEELLIGTIAEFLHDEQGNIYLLDGQLNEIQVLDPEGEWLRTIGRQGEGPGEFQNAADMFWAPGGQIGVVQAWPGKIVMITPDGAPGTTFALPYRDGGGWQSVTRGAGHDETVILAGTAWTRVEQKQMQFTYLKRYTADGEEAASFLETSKEAQFGDYEFIEGEYVDFQRRWASAPDGRVAAATAFDDYRIHIWRADGSLERIIERPDYKALQRSDAEIERFQAMYDAFTRWNRGSTFSVSRIHQAVERLVFRDDGSLWVQSGAQRWRADQGLYTAFDVYDREGRFMQRAELVADADAVEDGLFFAGDRAYVVTDLFNAIMAGVGGETLDEGLQDVEPVSVIAFDLSTRVALR